MQPRQPQEYPPHWEADVVAADGATVHLRPITPGDAERVVAFHAALSPRTRYLRYFSAYPTIPQRDLFRFTHMDNVNRVALAVWLGRDIIAIGRFDRITHDQPTSESETLAEVAFVVADAHQGRGIGSVLLEHLSEAAREIGIGRFEALVLAENRKMMRVFLDAGYQLTRQFEGSEVTLEFDITATDLTQKVVAEREYHAESRSIQRLLFPNSVAVIGASADERKIGHLVFENLQRGGFTGPTYPVSLSANPVNGVRSYRTVAEIDGQVDLAVLSVPASEVAEVIDGCGRIGVRSLVVISAGFGETGEGEQRLRERQAQRDLVTAARVYGMRVVGPNCLGVINTDPMVSLNASLSTVAPLPGRAGFFCQSGALGAAILGEANRRGLGLSSFVSAGNRADVSGNDLLQYWEADPATEVALLYLESFGNPRKFARIARRFARAKPIVAVKSGRGSVVAGLQHTSISVPEASVQALFEASGVIRTDTLGQLFDVAVLLTTQSLPQGDRVAVVGHSTALAVLVTDALAESGLELARQIDVGNDASPEEFATALRDTLSAQDVDSVVTIFVPPMRRGQEQKVAEVMRRAVAEHAASVGTGQPKPVLSVFMGFDGVPDELAVPGDQFPMRGSIPSYSSPERAVAALAHVTRYAHWHRRDAGRVPQLGGVDARRARGFVEQKLAESLDGRWLDDAEAAYLLGCYGITVIPSGPARTLAEAVVSATEIGWPVALKIAGAVRLHLNDGDAVAEAWESMGITENDHATVQAMAPRGVDTVLRMQDDRSFGSLVSFGVGGMATDLLEDRAYAVVPLTSLDAAELISGPKAFPLLTGYAGSEPADVPALVETALRLSALADDLPEVVECALEPLVAEPDGAHVLSARVRITKPTGLTDFRARRIGGL